MSIFEDHCVEDECWDYDPQRYIRSRKASLPLGCNAPHHPNKNEAKLLRRIMAETGLTKDQVRQHAKYRKMLSQEQDRGEKLDRIRAAAKWRRDEASRRIQEGHDRKAREAAEVAAKAFKKYQKTPDYIIDILRSENGNVQPTSR